MGRYTSVQAFSDNNPNMRSISYDQATGGNRQQQQQQEQGGTQASGPAAVAPGASNAGPVKTEKVSNPYSSTAGAGSGEFHVYRHARAREMARMKAIDEEDQKKKADLEFEQKVMAMKHDDRERTEKRKKKRQREKEARRRKKALRDNGLFVAGGKGDYEGNSEETEVEFEYTPIAQIKAVEGQSVDENSNLKSNISGDIGVVSNQSASKSMETFDIPTDGSFLATMMKKFTEKSSTLEVAPTVGK